MILPVKNDLDSKKRFISIVLSLFISIFCVIPILVLVSINFHSPDLTQEIKTFSAWDIEYFKPEHLENTLFLLGFFLTPIFIVMWQIILERYINKLQDMLIINKIYGFLIYFSLFTIISLFIADYINLKYSCFTISLLTHNFLNPASQLLDIITLIIAILLIIIAFYIAYLIAYKNSFLSGKILNFIPYLLIFIIILYCTFDIYNFKLVPYLGFKLHFNAVFYPVVQAFSGKEVLYDFVSLYGLYPVFLVPIFKIIGFSVLKFTFLMAVLTGLSFFFIFKFLKESLKNNLTVALGFTAVVYANYLNYKFIDLNDVYFPYHPIRTFFPALFIFMFWRIFNGNKKLFPVILFLCPITVLWNFDTGIILSITVIASLIYQELSENKFRVAISRIFKQLALYMAIFSAVFLVFMVTMNAIYGHMPDFGKYMIYQRFFYYYGFWAHPLQLNDPWNLTVLIYFSGLSFSINSMIRKTGNSINKIIFFLSILGIGLFPYYQSQSDVQDFYMVSYPAMLLLIIFIDRHLGNKDFRTVTTLFLAFILLLNFALINGLGMLLPFLTKRYTELISKEANQITRDADFIKTNTRQGEKVLILSGYAGTYYLNSNTVSPVGMASAGTMIYKKEFDNIAAFLKNNKSAKIFLDENFTNLGLDPSEDQNQKILNVIKENYKLKALSKDKTMKHFEKKT